MTSLSEAKTKVVILKLQSPEVHIVGFDYIE